MKSEAIRELAEKWITGEGDDYVELPHDVLVNDCAKAIEEAVRLTREEAAKEVEDVRLSKNILSAHGFAQDAAARIRALGEKP